MLEILECVICSKDFEHVRGVGRLPQICSADCRRESNRRRQARWFTRLKEAKAQLDTLQAAGMA
jgi:hypothetical protein